MADQPCIYCRRNDVPRTREHVLQAAFGATATLATEVCADCNSAFSPIDKSFLEAVQFYYTGENMLRQLGLGRTVLSDGTSVNARLRADGKGEFPPQIYESTSTEWKFLGRGEDEFHSMLAELAEPKSLQIKTRVVKAGDGVPPMAILRSAPRAYLVQGTEAAAVEQFAVRLKERGLKPDWFNVPLQRSSDQLPEIKFDTSLALQPFCQALAKIALNFVCYRLGAEVALDAAFDPVRRFARYGEDAFNDFAVPVLLNHTLDNSMSAFTNENHHGLFLVTGNADDGKRESVFLAIRGKTIGRLDLTRGNPGLPQGTWLLTRFDETRGTVENLALPDDMPRALLNPSVFGLQDIWPKEWT